MRARREIQFDQEQEDVQRLILEVLLDIRDQGKQALAMNQEARDFQQLTSEILMAQVANERDAILKASSVQGS